MWSILPFFYPLIRGRRPGSWARSTRLAGAVPPIERERNLETVWRGRGTGKASQKRGEGPSSGELGCWQQWPEQPVPVLHSWWQPACSRSACPCPVLREGWVVPQPLHAEWSVFGVRVNHLQCLAGPNDLDPSKWCCYSIRVSYRN